jgi:CPA1 family monovalent cation:H+ antiporter
MSAFDFCAVFMALVAATGWLNAKFMRLPPSVAMLLVGLLGAVLIQPLARCLPAAHVLTLLRSVNFPDAVVGYMLAFLLFAGAMQVDLQELRRRGLAVLTLATVGVAVSIVLVGSGVHLAANLFGLHLSLAWSIVFGALISPTDPVAVLATLRHREMAGSLKAILQGEALFNDGVGIVVFLAALALARHSGDVTPLQAAGSVLFQAVGGLTLGVAGGGLVVFAMRHIDDYAVEVAMTIALAAGVYALGQGLHVSGAIAAATAGLMVGDASTGRVMSETTRRYVRGFWTLIDELLNALLFLLLGLQMIILPFDLRYAGLWAVGAVLVLGARLATVLPWGAYFRFRHAERGASLILTWGGLRGALSVALALEVPQGPARGLILSLTYALVVFSLVIQGMTFGPLVDRLSRRRLPKTARKAIST